MTESTLPGARILGVLWSLLAVAMLLHSAWLLRSDAIATDLFALLPERSSSALQDLATRRSLQAGEAQVLIMLGHADANGLATAERAYRAMLDQALPELRGAAPDPQLLRQAMQFLRPWRDRVLTEEQRQQLRTLAPEVLGQQALERLFQPLPSGAGTPWQDDPLGLSLGFWQQQASASRVTIGEHGLRLRDGDLVWAVLLYRLETPAFALTGERRLGNALHAAEAAARQQLPQLQVLLAGVPLHADAAAAQAAQEMSTIGLGSLVAVLLLVWAAFRSLRPILLVASSLLVGCAAGLSITVLVFGEVHLLTLIFGSSLVGVAEDYGIHYFATRQAQPQRSARAVLAALRPSLLLALLTSALAYLALGAVPFPGLRQMAVFSAAGLAGAFLTVLLVFPWLDGAAPRPTRFARWLHASLVRLPALATAPAMLLGVAVLTVALWLARDLRVADDLRQLQGSPAELVRMQMQAGRLLGLPSPAQFFIVEARDSEQLLQAEQRLLQRLRPLRAAGRIGGWQAISDWVPSAQQQADDAALVAPAEAAALAAARAVSGEALESGPRAGQPLTLAQFAASPLAALQPGLLFGQQPGGWYSVVRLTGLHDANALPALAALQDPGDGVSWVDRTADYSALLGHYRVQMSGLLGLGLLAVAVALALRFRGRFWRALLPTVLAGAIAVAALAALGQPFTLFNVLALLLLLGMGVDYGIFLLEQPDGASWMAVNLGATSTLLAFGLLGLSATPALRAFGLTLLFGIAAVWLLSPLLRPPARMRGP